MVMREDCDEEDGDDWEDAGSEDDDDEMDES